MLPTIQSPLTQAMPQAMQAPAAPQFAGRAFKAPETVDEARFTNARIPVNSNQLAQDLLARLDEAMTVTGEVYAGNEAFTNVIELTVDPDATRDAGKIQAAVDTKVEHTLNVGSKQNVGMMVMSCDAKDAVSGKPIALARATFNAIDAESVKSNGNHDKLLGGILQLSETLRQKLLEGLQKLAALTAGSPAEAIVNAVVGKLKAAAPAKGMAVVPVTNLQKDEANLVGGNKAESWNNDLSGFYRNLGKRLKSAEQAELKESDNGKNRLVNTNVYVTTDMLNKKQTGHGGIAVANAVDDMQTLLAKAGKTGVVQRVSANYLAPFHASDSLQFDTTVDSAQKTDAGTEVILSSRISKMDTKSRTVEGPIILAHAKVLLPNQTFAKPDARSGEAKLRNEEAQAWDALG